MKANNSSPAIRFAGYSANWLERQLGEISSSYSGGTPAVAHREYYGGNIPFIRSAEISSDNTALYLTEEGLHSSSAALVDIGCVLYALYGATSGEVSLARMQGAINQAILAIIPQEGYAADFIACWLRKNKLAIINTYLQGGQGNLSAAIVKELRMRIPCLQEQGKIGSFISVIDSHITLHQRKYEKLVNLKKAMLDKMFPKNGELVPEVRFAGFSGNWERVEARKMFLSKADKGYPELPVLAATQDRGMIRRDENSILVYHDKKNEEGYKRVKPGQFVIHLRSFQGGFAHSKIEGITSPAYTVFGFAEPDIHDSEYWKYVFTSNNFIKRLETVTYGIRDGRSISYEEFLTLDFTFPNRKEQDKIAILFDIIGKLISLHQSKQERLINLKNAFLEKMFV